MQSAPLRDDETESLAALRELGVLDSAPEAEFDALVKAASLACGVPISLISLIDVERQWFKANAGLPGVCETSRDVAFCAHAVRGSELFEVPDASQDERFADNPLVVGHPDIRFYAGAPLTLSNGWRIGTLCVMDRAPRRLDETQRGILLHLARAAAVALESRRAVRFSRQAAAEAAQAALVLRHSADAVMGQSIDGRVLRWNEAAERLYGYSAAEMIGQSLDVVIPPSHLPDEQAAFARLAQGEATVYESVRQHRDGTLMHVAITMVPELDVYGAVLGATKFVRDISDRVRAEQALRQSQAFLDRTGRLAGVGGWEVDLATGRVIWSDATCRIHGVEPGHQPTMEEAIAYYPPEARSVMTEAVASATVGGPGFDLEVPFVRRDGVRLWVRSVGEVEFADGRPIRLVGAFQDVTESRELAAHLAEQHQLLRVTLQSIGDAVITTDAAGAVVWLNPVAERMTGWPADEAKDRSLGEVFRLVDETTRLPIDAPVNFCPLPGAGVDPVRRALLISRDGAELGIEESAAPIRHTDGRFFGVVLVFRDVTEQRRLSGEMHHRATHDALTGLVNRAEFELRLQRLLQRAREESSQHVMLYIDLDRFKQVNDACGHTVGDQLLVQVAKLLGEAVRTRDTLARLGGDEFAILLEHCSVEQGQQVAQKICDRMDDFRFIHEERRFRIGTSIGLVPVDARWARIDAIQQAADTCCYTAKQTGRNRVHVWLDTDQVQRDRHLEVKWTARIEQALDDDGFRLFAQRIEPLHHGSRGLRAEVLLRLPNDEGGLELPEAFLPAAERFHLSSRIDRWVLRRIIEWMRALPSLAGIEMLSLNLSGQSIADRAFHRYVHEALSEAGERVRRRLCFEITEAAAITHLSDTVGFIEQVRAVGVRVALVDFGAGTSSFGYLKHLPVDLLKIDGQFIRDLDTDALDQAAVRCFVEVARVVGVRTVAVAVEKPAILERLRELGIDEVQGFLLHQPAPVDDLVGALREA